MRNYLYAFSTMAVVAVMYVFNPLAADPKEKEEAIIKAVRTYIEQVHYSPKVIDDSFSLKAFNLYMEALDGSKRFLTKEEVNRMSKHQYQIDDELMANTHVFFDESNAIIEAAIDRAEDNFNAVIQHDFDFKKEESIQMDPEKRDYPKNEAALKDFWRKSIKYDILLKWYNLQDKQNNYIERLDTMSQMARDTFQRQSNADMLAEAKEDVQENFENWFKRIRKLRRSDRFESYINSIIHVHDPHSDYFNPKEKEDFDIRMSGKLEGIGARLSIDGEYTKVVLIIPGGPAWKGKELEVNDLISKVAQEGENPVSIEGMRLDDVVGKIRGKKGTKVTLTVKKPDGSFRDVTIVRDLVITEDGNAKSTLIEMEGRQDKIGYIYLPSFYADFKSKKGRSSAKDIAKEVKKLKAENVSGIILDLRNNGGGSLRDVVEMGGLFVERGPMVQVKAREGKPYVLEDEDPSVQYDGPLIIMTNDFSVSASEILAAAMQDYNRAIIVGSPSTFGKGTVQRFFPLDRVRGVKQFRPLGDLKMTIQKFYRIDGTSTQLNGVASDIVLPDAYYYIKRGEKDYDYPLEWTEIDAAKYKQNVYHVRNKEELKAKSKSRIENNENFNLILENARRLKENKADRVYDLNMQTFKSKLDRFDQEGKKFDKIAKDKIEGMTITNLDIDQDFIQADSSRIARNDDFLRRLNKDIYLEETMNIMNDMIYSGQGTPINIHKERRK